MECSFRHFLFLFHKKKTAKDSLTKSEFYHPVVELKSKMNGLRTWTASPGLEGEPQIVSGPIWPPRSPLTVALFQPGPDPHALEFPFWLRPHKRPKGVSGSSPWVERREVAWSWVIGKAWNGSRGWTVALCPEIPPGNAANFWGVLSLM